MAISSLPPGTPPPALHSQLLPILLRRLRFLRKTSSTSNLELLSTLQTTVRLLSSDRLRYGHLSNTTKLPLEIVYTLLSSSAPSPSQSTTIPLSVLIDLTAAYPTHRSAIAQIWTLALSSSSSSSSGGPNGDLVDIIQTQFLPSLISKLQLNPSLSDIGVVASLLLSLARAHEDLLAMMLSEADYILPALRLAYSSLSSNSQGKGKGPGQKEVIRVKETVLLFCVEVMGAVQSSSVKEGLGRLISGSGSPTAEAEDEAIMRRGGMFLSDNTLGQDMDQYLNVGETRGQLDGHVRVVLEEIRDDDARGDPRVQAILVLFPTLPPHQLLLALNHPTYASSSTSTAEEQASPLLDVILSGGSGLPHDLSGLKRSIQAMSEQQSALSISAIAPPPPPSADAPGTRKPYARANIFDNTALDLSRLKIKSEGDEPQPLALVSGLGKEVTDEMRASILRLVERQKVEAEEQARALAEARGEVYRPERDAGGYGYDEEEDEGEMDGEEGGGDGVSRVKGGRTKDGDESGEEEEVGENVVQSSKSKGKQPVVQAHSYDVNIQSKLELAYLADPKVFDRDGVTRRSAARNKLKQATGMDDSQIEGWRVMLDRNPHKEAILARHTFVPSNNLDYVVDGNVNGSNSDTRSIGNGSRGGGGGRGRGGRGGRGGGGSQSGRGEGSDSGSGRGGGGGRGRGQNKGSRGHSNAARTRGHDKKMSRMGQGV